MLEDNVGSSKLIVDNPMNFIIDEGDNINNYIIIEGSEDGSKYITSYNFQEIKGYYTFTPKFFQPSGLLTLSDVDNQKFKFNVPRDITQIRITLYDPDYKNQLFDQTYSIDSTTSSFTCGYTIIKM